MTKKDKIIDSVSDRSSIEECTNEMKKLGEKYIKSKYIESRLLADLMYRFALRIEFLDNQKHKKG